MKKKLINLILIALVIFCFGKVVFKYYQYYTDSKSYSQIQTLKPEVISIDNNIEAEDINNEYKLKEEELLKINKDYKMWLSVTDTNIDYPIVQGRDNEYYTTHDFNGYESISGALFIDSNNNLDIDKNIVIYGHHMKNETMFHNLNYFKEEEFFKENEISIIMNGKEYKYDPFSVYVIPEGEAVFNMSFIDGSSYKKYLEGLRDKSYFNRDINLDKDSEIITLITCSYEYDGARTIVHGIRYK